MAKQTKAQRPVDVKDMPWSHIGKDALDAAAERVWERLRHDNVVWNCVDDESMPQYHVIPSREQETVQRAVLDVLGFAVPAMLRQRAKDYPKNSDEADALRDLADELETDHG